MCVLALIARPDADGDPNEVAVENVLTSFKAKLGEVEVGGVAYCLEVSGCAVGIEQRGKDALRVVAALPGDDRAGAHDRCGLGPGKEIGAFGDDKSRMRAGLDGHQTQITPGRTMDDQAQHG